MSVVCRAIAALVIVFSTGCCCSHSCLNPCGYNQCGYNPCGPVCPPQQYCAPPVNCCPPVYSQPQQSYYPPAYNPGCPSCHP
ncbi:MAG: hypothetical protein AB7O26_13490 [Planctomycetaceae bacterium]